MIYFRNNTNESLFTECRFVEKRGILYCEMILMELDSGILVQILCKIILASWAMRNLVEDI